MVRVCGAIFCYPYFTVHLLTRAWATCDLVATFNTNYVTYEMLPELTDSDLNELGVAQVGWRPVLRRAISRLNSHQKRYQYKNHNNQGNHQGHQLED